MKCLVAVDGSEESEDALSHAIDIAEAMGGSVTVVHSVDPSVYDEGGSDPVTTLSDADKRLIIESVADAEDRGISLLESIVEGARTRGVPVETELLYGDPATEIPDFAATADFDAIFVGHRGRSERVGSMLGSVAKDLVERSPVPVTVVR